MANEYLNAAYATSLPAGPKAVLIALANRANKKGTCFPSVKIICQDTGLGRSTVYKHLATLTDDSGDKKSYVKKVNQNRKDGSQTSNLYKILLEPVKAATKAAKKAVKTVKKVAAKAVDMGNRVFQGKNDAKASSAPLSKTSTLNLDYDNNHWAIAVASICDRVEQVCPELNLPGLKDAVESHVEFWMLKAREDKKLTLTIGKLSYWFIARDQRIKNAALASITAEQPASVSDIRTKKVDSDCPYHQPFTQTKAEFNKVGQVLRDAKAVVELGIEEDFLSTMKMAV